ncbi:Kinesin-13A [Hibiscus syriacus]|uniref:Kinesin-13A n=1 Tax=Hibiscus syriacus TaxID=106335 RepID=A0A6A3D396_HIBSY|nr:Kinesin-13A [Hibiscus syriacus]
MSVVGRQMARSNSTTHHQRQYSDNFPDASFNAKWLQSSNLPSSQEFGFYGGGRMNRKSQEPGTPLLSSRSSSLRKNSAEYVPNLYEGCGLQKPIRGKSFDDSEPYVSTNKLPNRPRGMAENSILKSIAVDKERSNNVAKIKVVVRKRPLNKKEIAKKEDDIITIDSNALMVHEKKLKVDLTEYVEKHEFLFDAVLNEDVSNEEVYSKTVEPIVPLIFNRTKATCFAYGQTGSGKTYTMQPLPLKASQDILRLMYHTYRNQGFQLFVSYFEIYGGKVFDLLNDRKKLCMREDGKQQVCIVGLQEYKVLDVQTIKELIERGNATRSTGTTGANEESSRSHAILQLAIKRSADGSELKPARLVGKLSFIDLAGSAEINRSLLALKECIRALDNDQGHIPFRGSKLIEVLRDSYMGDSRTVMISCISPSSGSCEHPEYTQIRWVKCLSKGNNSTKDILPSSSNLRESTALPLSSSLLTDAFEDSITDIPFEKNKYGWSKPTERDASFKMDSVPSGRDTNLAVPYSDYVKGQRGGLNSMTEDDFDYFEAIYEQTKMLQKRKDALTEHDPSTFDNNNSDDDLSALLKRKILYAHRRQVEDTMGLVREEMNLLVEAEQPGNQLDDYISKLNTILSQKAAGIVQLQARLAQFQKHLKEYNVLVSSGN